MNEQQVIVWDIDMTFADCSHRIHHITETKPKDWDAFDAAAMQDRPIFRALCLNKLLYRPWIFHLILTGRHEKNRQATEDWLHTFGIQYDHLEMRRDKDYRKAGDIKLERLQQMGYKPKHVITIFEDDPYACQLLREHGYHVCRVADGEYIEALSEGGEERAT